MSLPISKSQAITCSNWLKTNFQDKIIPAVNGTPYSLELICGIFCQETAYKVQLWIDGFDVNTILARCVFDASGDFPGTTRNAFPKNVTEFHDKYGNELTDMLISEGNKQRKMPQQDAPNGYKNDSHFLYKGYGIFQYDIQAIQTDYDFFAQKQWYIFDNCLDRLIRELNSKMKDNLWQAVKSYNGSGEAATEYANNVMQFAEYAT